jgi:DNA-binding GntR family transcriptional regulator
MIEANRLRRISASNLRSEIKKAMQEAILHGVFKPGERLVESDIAENMGVSRAPVREVLSALEHEGLVVNVPRRGSFVVAFTDKDIEEIYSLRLLLEIGAVKRAIPRLTTGDRDVLQKLVDELGEQALRRDDFDVLVNLDLRFHEYLFSTADHRRLFSAWKSLSMQTRLLIGITSKTYDQYPQQPKELHQEILDAIFARDEATAEHKMTIHILDAQTRAVTGMKQLHTERGAAAAALERKR